MNIIFFGSDPWFSPPVLEAILKAGHEVPVVVTKGTALTKNKKQKTKNKKFYLQAKTAEDITVKEMVRWLDGYNGIESFRHLNNPNPPNRSFSPDAIVLAAFGPPFLPPEVLRWPKYGCLNVHASLLPRWRGASPVFGAIANGDKETGVSIMRMTKEIDLGPILGQVGLKVSDNDTREMLTKKLGILGGKLIVETLKKLQNGQINEIKQPSKSPTFYTHRLTKDLGKIDWRFRPGETDLERSRRIERFIRAVTPWPGAWTKFKDKGRRMKDEGRMLKILKVHLEFSHSPIPTPKPTTNNQQLVIDLVQLPGKNPISWKQFLAGHPGAKLE